MSKSPTPPKGNGRIANNVDKNGADREMSTIIDDNIRASVTTMFQSHAENDIIAVENFFDIVDELNIEGGPDYISKFINDNELSNLTLDTCLAIVGRLLRAAQRRGGTKERNSQNVVVSQSAVPVVYVNTLAYLKLLSPCSKKDEGTEYRWKRPKIEVRPKVILMISISLMEFVAALVLTIMIISLNRRISDKEAQDHLNSIREGSLHSENYILTDSITHVGGRYLIESMTAVQDGIELLLTLSEATVLENLESMSLLAMNSVNGFIHADTVNRGNDLVRTAKNFQSVFKFKGNENMFKRNVEKFSQTNINSEFIVAFANNVKLFSPSKCNNITTESDSICFQSAYGVMGHSNECGEPSLWVKGFISSLNIDFCLYQPDKQSNRFNNKGLSIVISSFNLASSTSESDSLSVEVAYMMDSTPINIGGRNRFSSFCINNDLLCENHTQFYTSALSLPLGDVKSGFLKGDDLSTWMAAYGRIVVDEGMYLIGAKVVESSILFDFISALSSVFNQYPSSVNPSVLMGYTLELGEPQILPIGSPFELNDDQRSMMSRSIYGRSGTLYPKNSSQSLSVFAAARTTRIGIIGELTSPQLFSNLREMISEAFNLLQLFLPADTNLLLFKKNSLTGEIELFGGYQNQCDPCYRHTAAVEGFETKGVGRMIARDHNNKEVYALYAYYDEDPPIVTILQIGTDELNDYLSKLLYAFILVAIAIYIAVQIALIILTQRVLNRIEQDYNRYRKHIENEKKQFGDLVKDVMPPGIAQKVMRGTRLIAETHPQLTFFFSDIIGAPENTKTDPKQLVRTLGYTFMLEDEIANHFNIHKIKLIGDVYFAVSGLEDNSDGANNSQGHNHQVYRMVSFACICQQVFGSGYAHYPERIDCFRQALGSQDNNEPMKMVRLRMGIHTGPAVAGVVDIGRAPHFDCFGPSVNFASRMESTATAGRVQISDSSVEILTRLDKEGLFEFESPRKTLVKGYGTMTTYLIKSTNLKVPLEILSKLKIERAHRRQFFQPINSNMIAGVADSNHSGERSRDRSGDTTPINSSNKANVSTPAGLNTTPISNTPQNGNNKSHNQPNNNGNSQPNNNGNSQPNNNGHSQLNNNGHQKINSISDPHYISDMEGFNVALPPPMPDF